MLRDGSKDLVSVVMASYNTDTYLTCSIYSILNQTYNSFELIIIDDYSTDGSRKRLAALKEKYGFKLLLNQKNFGPSASRNFGINIARGKYIAILDSDDISVPSRLEEQVNYLKNNPEVSICYGNVRTYGYAKSRIKMYPQTNESFKKMLLKYSPMCHSTAMLRREVFEEIGLYDESLRYAEDLDLWIRASRLFNFGNTDTVLGYYCVRNDSLINLSSRSCEWSTLAVRLRSVKKGVIKPSISDYIYNFFQVVSYFIVPHKLKQVIYNKILFNLFFRISLIFDGSGKKLLSTYSRRRDTIG